MSETQAITKNDPGEIDSLNLRVVSLLYEEVGRQHRYFLDWRHRIMTRFFLVIAGCVTLAKWLSESEMAALFDLVFYHLWLGVSSRLRVV